MAQDLAHYCWVIGLSFILGGLYGLSRPRGKPIAMDVGFVVLLAISIGALTYELTTIESKWNNHNPAPKN